MSIKQQGISFILVGILNTLVGYAMYAFFIFVGLHYAMAVLLATGLGVLFNFKTTGKIVFNNNDNKLFFKFVLGYVFLYFLNIALIRWLQLLSGDLYLVGLIAVVPLAMMAFLLNKYFVFGKVYEIN